MTVCSTTEVTTPPPSDFVWGTRTSWAPRLRRVRRIAPGLRHELSGQYHHEPAHFFTPRLSLLWRKARPLTLLPLQKRNTLQTFYLFILALWNVFVVYVLPLLNPTRNGSNHHPALHCHEHKRNENISNNNNNQHLQRTATTPSTHHSYRAGNAMPSLTPTKPGCVVVSPSLPFPSSDAAITVTRVRITAFAIAPFRL